MTKVVARRPVSVARDRLGDAPGNRAMTVTCPWTFIQPERESLGSE